MNNHKMTGYFVRRLKYYRNKSLLNMADLEGLREGARGSCRILGARKIETRKARYSASEIRENLLRRRTA
jgi:hypothetical protein